MPLGLSLMAGAMFSSAHNDSDDDDSSLELTVVDTPTTAKKRKTEEGDASSPIVIDDGMDKVLNICLIDTKHRTTGFVCLRVGQDVLDVLALHCIAVKGGTEILSGTATMHKWHELEYMRPLCEILDNPDKDFPPLESTTLDDDLLSLVNVSYMY